MVTCITFQWCVSDQNEVLNRQCFEYVFHPSGWPGVYHIDAFFSIPSFDDIVLHLNVCICHCI